MDEKPLVALLAGYDGVDTGPLVALLDRFGSGPGAVPEAVVSDAILLCTDAEGRLAAGASWLLRRWVERGLVGSGFATEMAPSLASVRDRWTSLHLLQAIPGLEISASAAPEWSDFCRRHLTAESPFVRAWATNALWHLARRDPALESEARAALERALVDPKASVRARARRLLEEG